MTVVYSVIKDNMSNLNMEDWDIFEASDYRKRMRLKQLFSFFIWFFAFVDLVLLTLLITH